MKQDYKDIEDAMHSARDTGNHLALDRAVGHAEALYEMQAIGKWEFYLLLKEAQSLRAQMDVVNAGAY